MTMNNRLSNNRSSMTTRFIMFMMIFLFAFGVMSGSVFAKAGDTPAHSKSLDDNGDGTYSYNVDKHFMDGIDPKVVFNDGGKNQAPKSGGFIIKDGQEYDENYSD